MYLNIAILSAFLLVYSKFGGRLEKTPISGALVFTAVGLIFGPAMLGLLDFRIDGAMLRLLAEITLAILLFVDASLADLGVIRKHFGILGRLLLIGLPLTIAAGFGVGLWLFPGVPVLELALLAVILAPTDAALGKPVVTNKAIPDKIREALSFESGLNDGICVPILLLFLHLATQVTQHISTGDLMATLFVHEIGIGALTGLGVVAVAVVLLRFTGGRGWVSGVWQRVVVAAMAVTCFSAAQALGGSGLIASFVGGLLFGAMIRESKHELLDAGEVFGEVFTLITWVFFGAAVVGQVMNYLSWPVFFYAILSLTLVRMVPVFLSLTGSGVSTEGKLFIGWFGPRGLASIVFAVMVANSDLSGGRNIAIVVAITVVFSVIAHGLTANPFSAAFVRSESGESQDETR